MGVSKGLFTVLAAGITFAAGMTLGADLTQENEFHTERFEAVIIDGEGFYGEPVDNYGNRIAGEGVFIEEVALVPIEINEGDIVAISWTEQQAEFSDWATPAKIVLQEDRTHE